MSTKSFVIGGLGALISLGGAQAADLPVKAAPVQYVKVCSMYGVGFYYIPGSDICIRIGGYVRAQSEWNSFYGITSGSSNNAFLPTLPTRVVFPTTASAPLFSRQSNNFNYSGQGVIDVDARSQSEYGTIRAFLRIGGNSFDGQTAASSFYAPRAFIQFAGFTAGVAQSYFDIFSNTELFSYTDSLTSGDTYNYGVNMFAYTARFGNGISATIAAEVPRYRVEAGVVNGAAGGFGNGPGTSTGQMNINTTQSAGFNMPDIVGNLRIDQAWGYLGVSGAIHKVAGQYYSGTTATPINGVEATHPDDKYGWAAGTGGLVYLPWDTTAGASFVYSHGALGYATKAGNWQITNGTSVGVGWGVDGVYDNVVPFVGSSNTQIELTNAWSVNAGAEHMWNPRWRTSVYGGYTRVWYNQAATNLINQHLPTPPLGGLACGVPVEGSVWPPINVANGVGNSCSPNFSFYQIGSRTQWDVSRNLYMGMDVTYTHLHTAYEGTAVSPVTSVDDQSVVSGIFRVQYNLIPDAPPPGARWR